MPSAGRTKRLLSRHVRSAATAVWAGAFLVGLVAAAPHSVHHLGQEAEVGFVDCPGALAWAAASGADGHTGGESLDPPSVPESVILELPSVLPSGPVATCPTRAPPPPH